MGRRGRTLLLVYIRSLSRLMLPSVTFDFLSSVYLLSTQTSSLRPHTHVFVDMSLLKIAHSMNLAGIKRQVDEDMHFLVQECHIHCIFVTLISANITLTRSAAHTHRLCAFGVYVLFLQKLEKVDKTRSFHFHSLLASLPLFPLFHAPKISPNPPPPALCLPPCLSDTTCKVQLSSAQVCFGSMSV
jgi:hypothetical protein